MGLSTGHFAVIALHAQGLINQQDVRGFADPLTQQEPHQIALATRTVLENDVLLATGKDLLFDRRAPLRVRRNLLLHALGTEHQDLGQDCRGNRCRARRVIQKRHLTDIVTG